MNFGIIDKSIRGEKIPENDLENYQTVKMDSVKKYPKKNKLIFCQLSLELIGKTFTLEKKSFENTLNNVKNNCTCIRHLP